MSDSEDQAGVPLLDNESISSGSPPPSANASKRKRGANDDADADDAPAATTSKRAAKRAKMKKKPSKEGAEDSLLDLENGLNPAIGYMDSRLMSDHVAQRTKRFRPEMSLVEAEDVHISGGWIEKFLGVCLREWLG